MGQSHYSQLGGEPVVRAIIDAFVERMAADAMIGFFFRHVPLPALKQREFEHAAAHLGGPVAYRGRPLRRAHGSLTIFAGHFRRRLVLLQEVLGQFAVPAPIAELWLARQRSLEAEVRG